MPIVLQAAYDLFIPIRIVIPIPGSGEEKEPTACTYGGAADPKNFLFDFGSGNLSSLSALGGGRIATIPSDYLQRESASSSSTSRAGGLAKKH